MAYVYRYIDLEKQEVVYIGKVTGDCDEKQTFLRQRHYQHMMEDWYKENADNLIMQFIEVNSHADADILETWLISQYQTGQLFNIAKTKWGKSKLDLWLLTVGHWRTFNRGCFQCKQSLHDAAEILYNITDGLEFDVNHSLEVFCSMVHDIVRERTKAERLSRCEEQDEFFRRQGEIAK